MAGDKIFAGRLGEFAGIFVLQGLELPGVVFGILLIVGLVGRIGLGQCIGDITHFLLGVDQAEPNVRVIVAVIVGLFFIGEFDRRNALRGIDRVKGRVLAASTTFEAQGSMPSPL